MGRKVRIGLIQVKLDPTDDMKTKWDKLYELGERCLNSGAELVFFPEAYQYAHDWTILSRLGELRDAAACWKERCAVLAKQYKAYVVPWDFEVDDAENRYNAAYILDRNGVEIGRYRKVQITYKDTMWGGKTGNDFPVFDLDFGKVGIMICYDNYFQESAQILGLRGAELILYPLYGDTLSPQWELKFRARAVDNSLYIASSQIDNIHTAAYTGLVNPLGEVVCRLDGMPSWKVVEVDLGYTVITSTGGNTEYRENLKQLLQKGRNVAAYGPITQPIEERSWEEIFLGNRPPLSKEQLILQQAKDK